MGYRHHPEFIHRELASGLVVSFCATCAKMIAGSRMNGIILMAEDLHLHTCECRVRLRDAAGEIDPNASGDVPS